MLGIRAVARTLPMVLRRAMSATAGKPIVCKAAVATGPGQPLVVQDVTVGAPKAGEVRVKLMYTGVCHTDAYTLSGADPEGLFPAILGHEGAGIVESVGEGVTSVKPGDSTVLLYVPECGTCSYCTHKKGTNLCQKIRVTQGAGLMPDGTSRLATMDAKKLYHYMGCSSFSQYSTLPEISVAKISPKANLQSVCLLGCGVTTGIGAVRKTAKVEAGATVAVFGLGAVGVSVVQGAKLAKAATIIGVDTNPGKEAFARSMGMTHFVNPAAHKKPIQEVLVEMTNGGVDYSFECVGSVKLMRAALEAAHKGWGECIIIGVAGAGEEIATRPFQLVTGRVWRGSAFGGVKGRSELPAMVSEYMAGQIKVDEYVTHTMPLARINEAFDLMKRGESVRTVISLWD